MKTTEKSVCTDEHVVAMTSTEATGNSEQHETCDKCHSKDTGILHMKKEITEINTIIKLEKINVKVNTKPRKAYLKQKTP